MCYVNILLFLVTISQIYADEDINKSLKAKDENNELRSLTSRWLHGRFGKRDYEDGNFDSLDEETLEQFINNRYGDNSGKEAKDQWLKGRFGREANQLLVGRYNDLSGNRYEGLSGSEWQRGRFGREIADQWLKGRFGREAADQWLKGRFGDAADSQWLKGRFGKEVKDQWLKGRFGDNANRFKAGYEKK